MMSIRIVAAALWLTVSVSLAGGADNTLTDKEKADGWKLLFNGVDHTGWKCNNGKTIATPVEDGSLLPYKSGGYLIVHETPVEDFILSCDVKQDGEKCNSGLFFRVSDLNNPVYSGLELQIYEAGTGYHDFGAVYDLQPPSKNAVRPNDWNHLVLTCKGPHITVEINGVVVNQMNCDDFAEKGLRPDGSQHKFGVAIKDLPRKGFIGFQDHGKKAWFKNVKLKAL